MCVSVALLFAFALAGCADGSDGAAPVPGRGVAAPTFEADLLSGAGLRLDDLIGTPIVLNFWATTCRPCLREMPLLAETAAAHGDGDLVVIGVDSGEDANRIAEFIAGFEVDIGYPIVVDTDWDISRLYRVAALPTTYFIDRDGVIQYRRIGELAELHLNEGLSRIS